MHTPSVAPLASLDTVGVSYRAVLALRGISLKVYGGSVPALLGRNGAGKSTAISVRRDLRCADAGTAVLLGHGHSARYMWATPMVGQPIRGSVVVQVRVLIAVTVCCALLVFRRLRRIG